MMTFSTKKLNFRYEQVKIGTVLADFWTVQVKYRTVQITIRQNQVENLDSTRQSFKQIKLKCGYVQVEIETVQDQN